MTRDDTQRLSHLLEDAVHDGAIGDVLHLLWETCERSGRRDELVSAVDRMADVPVAVGRVRPPKGPEQTAFFPVTDR